jgi:hypothetical protein
MCVSRVAAASRAVPVTREPVRLGLLPLADVADRECRVGGPERVNKSRGTSEGGNLTRSAPQPDTTPRGDSL